MSVTTQPSVDDIIALLRPHLLRSPDVPVVLMTCGIAGSGKSTLAKAVVSIFPSFYRVSIDELVASRYGIYNVDYPPDKYEQYTEHCDRIYYDVVARHVRQGRNVVADRSFYAREDRDIYRKLVEEQGGRHVLVYLRAEKDVLWRRICERRAKGVDANSALEISEELLDRYVEGFEAPQDEDQITVDVS